MARVWKRREDGTAPEEAQVGDFVVTNGGTYKVGDKDFYHPQINTYNYKGEYANPDMQALTNAAAGAKPLNQPPAPTVPKAVRQTGMLGADANAALAEYFNASRRRSGARAYPGSEWDARTRQLINQALGMDYNTWAQGDDYKALAARYARQGQQAMDDTISQIAARTGGLASSYAGVAGQAQYNEYMQRLEDAARQQFAQDRADAVQNAGLSQQMGAEKYQRWLDEQSRRANEDNTQLQLLQQIYGNEVADRDYAHAIERETADDIRRDAEIAMQLDDKKYERSERKRLEEKSDKEKADATAKQDAATAKKEARDEVDAIIAALGTPPAALVEASGYSPEYIATMQAAAKSAAVKKASGGGGGGGGGGTPKLEDFDWSDYEAELAQYGQDGEKHVENTLREEFGKQGTKYVRAWKNHLIENENRIISGVNQLYASGQWKGNVPKSLTEALRNGWITQPTYDKQMGVYRGKAAGGYGAKTKSPKKR